MSLKTVRIAYGREGISLALDPTVAAWTVLQPAAEPPLHDARAAFLGACEDPIGAPPLSEIVGKRDRVVIVTADGTRPVPNSKLIPWILDQLPVPPSQVTVLIGTGSHRANTPDEIDAMFGADLAGRVAIVNHDAFDEHAHVVMGATASGAPVALDRRYVEADTRIAVGFIEPHFVAGFSGGPKAIAPGIASIDTILNLHNYELIGHPQSTWGLLDGNPLHAAIRDAVALCPPHFLANVTLNLEKEITACWCGDYVEAHRAGCAYVKRQAMAPVPAEFPVVITSNSGFPLDQNLYQTVKGMSAAALIVENGGTLFVASECSDGVPSHGNFGRVLSQYRGVAAIEGWLKSLEKPVLDQWQIQLLAGVLRKCGVRLHSELDDGVVESCNVQPCREFQRAIYDHVRALGQGTRVAVLPQGPLTIPYVA